MNTLRRLRLAGYVMASVTLAATAACGNHPTRAHLAGAATSNAVVPAPGAITVSLGKDSARVAWSTPTALSRPLTGYDFYLDQQPAVPLGPQVTSRLLSHLAAGSEHFVQVVARSAGDLSLPTTKSFTVPYGPPKPPEDVAIGPAASGGGQSAAVGAAGGQPAAGAAPVGGAQGVPAPGTGIAASGTAIESYVLDSSVADSTTGTTCHGWEPKIEMQDGAGAIVALGELSGGSVSDRKRDQYDVTWTCTFTYRVATDSPSPVFTLVEYNDLGGKKDRPYSTTVSRSALAGGKAPQLATTYCTC